MSFYLHNQQQTCKLHAIVLCRYTDDGIAANADGEWSEAMKLCRLVANENSQLIKYQY